MKITIDQYQFADLFDDYNRGGNFSREARELIFDYLDCRDPNMEADIIAICSEYSEDSIYDIADSYNIDIDRETMDDDDVYHVVLEFLYANTSVIGSTYNDTHIVYEQF